jgi:hypothetical protein
MSHNDKAQHFDVQNGEMNTLNLATACYMRVRCDAAQRVAEEYNTMAYAIGFDI